MGKFTYRGLTKDGRAQGGTVVAENDTQAILVVERMGLIPVDIVEEKPSETQRFFGRRLKGEELILFARQLQTLLDAGVPLTLSISTLAKQTNNKGFREALEAIKSNIQMGKTFSESLALHPDKFPELFVSMVKAGEESGLIIDMLDKLSSLLEYEAETKARLKTATSYPLLIVGELGFAFIVLVKIVLPKFVGLFTRSGVALPLPTRVLVGISHYTEANWPIIVGAGVFLAVGYKVFSRTQTGKYTLDGMRIRIPIIGPLILKSLLSRFARILAALVSSGFPIVRSLEIVGNTVGNSVLLAEIEKAKAQVIKGRGLAEPFEASRVFPPMVVKMIAIGEETGSLDKMLTRTSNYYDREVDYSIKNLTTVLEPILILVLGATVLFVALAVFLPMWNLMSALRH